jgi:hypothetical protein
LIDGYSGTREICEFDESRRVITHPISAVVRAACLRASRPWSDIIFEIYAISYALVQRCLSHRLRIVLDGSLAGIDRVLQVLLHQRLMGLRVAESLKGPQKLNKETETESFIS